ncbi:MAG: hypothetical protein HRT66_02955 [Flavobacteriaceae bacterium]|nr:hypothetical protein [Flavobacteriaceae bacterium]
MRILNSTILLLLIITSCELQENKVDNTEPLYGEVKKNKEHKEIDKDFIEDCLNKFGSIDNSVTVLIDNSWKYFYNNDSSFAVPSDILNKG